MIKTAISAVIDELRPDLVAFLQQLVRSPSLPGEEGGVQRLIAAKLEELGLEVDVFPVRFDHLRSHPAFNDDGFSADQRLDVVGRWKAVVKGEGKNVSGRLPAAHGSLILNGHVDVVSPGDLALWSTSPWSGEVRDGKLYGRGACDMKGGLTAGIFALQALRRLGFEPAFDILLESVIGEESGGAGSLATIVNGYRADACVVLEPTQLCICPLQSGALTFRLSVNGKATHAAVRQHGISAIDKFIWLYAAIQQLEVERHANFQNQFYDPALYAAPISIGVVRAGEWHSSVAEKAVAEGRMGVFPGESAADARRALEDALARAASQDAWLKDHPPLVEWFEGQFESGATDPAHPLIQQLAARHTEVLEVPPAVRGVPYGSDLRLFTNHAGIPTVLYGPGNVSLAHGADEYIALDEVVTAARVIAGFVAHWCG